MTEILAQILAISREVLVVGFIVFLRVGAVMAVLPAFGEQSVPARVKIGLTLAFTLIVAPAVAPDINQRLIAGPGLWFIMAGEIAAGLVMGVMLRLFVLTLQVAGSIAAQSTSLAQIFGGNAAEPLPAMGHIMVISGLALAVMSGLHVRVAEVLIGSYLAFPVATLPTPSLIGEWGTARVARAFAFAFTLAAPFVIASLIYNLALGVINRAMPQLMVAFVGAPAITAGGLIILFLSLPLIIQLWGAELMRFLANPYETPG